MKRIHIYRVLCLAVTVSILPNILNAQALWLDQPNRQSEVGIDVLIPSYDNREVDGAAFASYFFAHIPVSDKWEIQLDLPLSHWSDGGGESNMAVGNPYLGIEYGGTTSFSWDLGIRAPVLDDYENAMNTGFDTANYQIPPFFPHTMSVISNVHYRSLNEEGFNFRVGGGPEAYFATEGSGGELFLKYYGQALYTANDLTFGAGLNGRMLTTENDVDFSARTNHNAAFSASYDFGRFGLGSYVEIPLDDNYRDYLNTVIGARAAIQF